MDLSSLVIRLSADTATLQGDLGRAAGLSEQYSAKVSSAWNSVGVAIGAGVAAAATGLTAMVKRSIDAADNFSKMSQKVGISVESLSTLNVQAKLSDVSIESLQGGLSKLARNATDAASGGKEQAAAFKAMGIAVRDSSGALRPMESILEDVAKKMASYEDGTGKTALAQKLLGKSGAELLPLLNQLGQQGFAGARKEAEHFGQVISTETAAKAEEFNDNITKTEFGLTSIANTIVADLLPSLVTSSRAFAEWINSDAVKTGVTTLVNDVAGLVGVLAQVPDELASIDLQFQQWNGTLTENKSLLGSALEELKSFTNFKPGAPLTISWSPPDWLKAITTPTAGSALDEKMTKALTAPIEAVRDSLKLIVPDIDTASKGFDGLTKHVEATVGAASKIPAPIVHAAEAATKVARANREAEQSYRAWANAVDRISSISSGLAGDIEDIRDRMSGADAAQIEYNKTLRVLGEEYENLIALGVPVEQAFDEIGNASELAKEKLDMSRAADAQKEAFDQMNAQLEENKRRWESWADIIVQNVMKGGNFLKNLLESVKQIVAQIISEWLKTRIVGLFMGGGGGGGFGSLVQAGLGAVSTGSGGSAASTAVDFTSTSSGSNFSIMSPSSWISAGKKLWEGFTSTQGVGSASSIFGTYMAPGSQYATVGNLNMASAYGSGELSGAPLGGGYTPSTFGYLAAGAAGVYAGYNRWQGSNKDFGGALGGVAYGVGTYGAALGVGAAATTGSLSVGLAAVPVVGWIALAAMAVDYLSGGKLFGTKGKLDHSNLTLDVGSEGFNLAQSYTLKGQKAFFGGTKWTTENVQASPEAMAAAQQFYDAILKNRDAFAKQFNAQIGDLVGGTYQSQYDKKGNLTSQSATVMGHEYKDADQEAFAKILTAENMIAVLGQFDDKLSAMADTYRGNIDAITEFAQASATAEAAIQAGANFLALGADQSLTAFLRIAEGSEQMGESIGQAVERLIQAQSQYDQFVAQFKPATTYVDDFEASMASIRDSMKGAMDQANALARAAGAQGAATKDLVNIQQRAAQQMAAALQQLEASAQSLAFNLGLSTQGSLDQVNSEIERLQAKANAGAQSVGDFGGAIQSAAQKASDAINLLIGDLSPLNDMQKLEEARKGLMAGAVSQEQFLQIARRLYASSAQYEREFAFAQQFPGRNTGSFGGSGRGGSANVGGGLTSQESQRLADLLKQQQQLTQAAQLAQFQTLAQQIAEIASAKGEDYMQVIQDLGIDLKGLEEGLGLSSDDALKAYLDTRQAQLDSEGENTKSIVDKLEEIRQAILGGTMPGADTGHSGHEQPGSDTPNGGHSGRALPGAAGTSPTGHSNRNLTDDDAEAIGDAVGRAISRPGPYDRRNDRR